MSLSSNFIDRIEIFIKSGHGGAGSIHFRREKFIQKGGPDGGDGGKGGDIIFIGNKNISTLYHLYHKRHFMAHDGENGGEKNSSGSNGSDIVIDLPIGTIVTSKTTGKILAQISRHNERIVVMQGGEGGLGNSHFKSPTNQTPRYAQPGLPGGEDYVIVELQLLADVGLVGFPNVGKSTLLSVVSHAKPVVADYAFTTLSPQLGVVGHKNNSFIMVDLPGIIEGASSGKGLGLQFLRHIEKCRVLLFLIDASSRIPVDDYQVLKSELLKYNKSIIGKNFVVAISRIDLIDHDLLQQIKKDFKKIGIDIITISSHQNRNIELLLDRIVNILY